MSMKKTQFIFEKTLFTLLEKKNYHDITINEICDVAKKAKMTFYRYYKDKEQLLAEASINLVNREYSEEYNKIIAKENDYEEIEYQAILSTFELVAKHYEQISNLIYKGDRFPLEVFKNALFENYRKDMADFIDSIGSDIPGNFMSIFFFEGLYNSALYYAQQLKKNKNKKKIIEDNKKLCRILAKVSLLLLKNK